MVPSTRDAKSSPVRSVTGSASMSARSSTAGPCRPPPRSTAVTEVSDVPMVTSSGRPSSAATSFCWVPRKLEADLGLGVDGAPQVGEFARASPSRPGLTAISYSLVSVPAVARMSWGAAWGYLGGWRLRGRGGVAGSGLLGGSALGGVAGSGLLGRGGGVRATWAGQGSWRVRADWAGSGLLGGRALGRGGGVRDKSMRRAPAEGGASRNRGGGQPCPAYPARTAARTAAGSTGASAITEPPKPPPTMRAPRAPARTASSTATSACGHDTSNSSRRDRCEAVSSRADLGDRRGAQQADGRPRPGGSR